MFEDLIKLLLEKKAEIDRAYEEKSAKIAEMLNTCGYVEPVAEVEPEKVEEITETEPLQAEANNSETVY